MRAHQRLRGVLLMLAAVGIFAVMDAFMKVLTASYPPMQVAFLRGVSSLPIITIAYALSGRLRELRPVRWGLHLVRAALAVAMLWGFVWALARASMADTYAIFMSSPLLVALVAFALLGERIGRQAWLAILAGLAGVFVMLKPSAAGFASLAGLAALLAALAYAFVVVLVRLMARTESTASMVFWFLLMLSAGAAALAAPGWVRISAADWPWILGIGLAGAAGQYLITEAFRLAPAAAVAPYEYTGLVWAVGIDWLAWQALPGARLLAGAAIVVGSGLYFLHRERRRAFGGGARV